MLTKYELQRIIKNSTTSTIYNRGKEYYIDNHVTNFDINELDENNVEITGKVLGSQTYDVTLKLNSTTNIITYSSCTCPYNEAWLCKHIVALGIAFSMTLTLRQPTGVISRFQKLLQDNLIFGMPFMSQNDLSEYADNMSSLKTHPTSKAAKKITTIKKEFDIRDYYFTLSKYEQYAATLKKVGMNYFDPPVSLKDILLQKSITASQREVFQYILDTKSSDRYNTPVSDIQKLFQLLNASEIPVFYNLFEYEKKKPVILDLNPERIPAEITYRPFKAYYKNEFVRHEFFLTLPKSVFPVGTEYWYQNPFFISKTCAVKDVKKENKIELYKLTPLLCGLLNRLTPITEDTPYGKSRITPKVTGFEVQLNIEEIKHLDLLAKDAFEFLNLTSPFPQFTPELVNSTPFPAFEVDLSADQATLHVIPVIDYGIKTQDISESVFISRKARGPKVRRRMIYSETEEHILEIDGDKIKYIPIDSRMEIDFYKRLQKDSETLGFTKTLKFQRKGRKKIEEFLILEWPKISEYAKKHNYEVRFTNEVLPTNTENFHAAFTTEINTDNDWLYFDVACYCGEESITLEKLFAFIKSGDQFWKKEDGTLVEIANRDALERLVRLLKSFHKRENGGFEGKVSHASELEYVMTSSSYYDVKRADSFSKFLKQAQEGRPVQKVELDKEILGTLRPYQAEGIEWLYFLRSFRFAGILADDMGLGKTLQTLCLLDRERISDKPSLIVCPKTLIYNWQKEAQKFFPSLRTFAYDGNLIERREKIKLIRDYDIVITSYPILKQDKDLFITEDMMFNYVVLDEAQFIKNHVTKNAQIVKQLNAEYRLALTGTPLENNVVEVWSMFDFLMPGFLGNLEQFMQSFGKPIMDKGNVEALTHLRSKIRPFMLRRTKSEVLKELPAKIEQTYQCELTEDQNVLYQQVLENVRGDIFSTVKEKGFQSSQIHILAGLMKLRQVCNHPALLTQEKDFRKYPSAKLELCMQLVDEVVESKRKVLIFSQFTSMLDIIAQTLKDRKIPFVYLSGKTKNRQEVIDTFNSDSSIPVFLISLKAGGMGINLTSADTVIIFDPWWNPSVENQAIDRAHRIGQTKSVNVYRLLTVGTIEEKIQVLKDRKQKLFNALVSESTDIFKKLTWDDVKELFRD